MQLDEYRKLDAMLMYYCGIPFPEELDDEVYWEKLEQLEWIRETEAQTQSGQKRPPRLPNSRKY